MNYALSLFHPLTHLTIGLIAGISFFSFSPLFVCASLGIFFIFTKLSQSFIPHIFSIGTLFIIGFLIGFARMYISHTKPAVDFPILCDIRGTVVDLNLNGSGYFKHTVTLDVYQYSTSENKGVWYDYKKRILIYTHGAPTVRLADVIECNNMKIGCPKKDRFLWYLQRDGIDGTSFATRWSSITIIRPYFSVWRLIFEWRQNLIDRIKNKLDGITTGWFCSLFLGSKTELKKESKTTSSEFKRWGIAHQLARSGLHLVIFIAICFSLLRLAPLPFIIKQLVLILLALCYFLLSWPTISFARAALVFGLHKLCMLLSLPTHFLYLLTLVCFLVLLYNPLHLFFLDFQLSFLFTFALLRISHTPNNQILINDPRLS